MGKKITSLVNTEAIKRNRYYFSILVDIVVFLATHLLTFKRKIDPLESEDKEESGLLLNVFNYPIEKDQRLRAIIKTIPRNATYTTPHMQNELIAV